MLGSLPALTRFYHGAIHAANVDEFTTRELSEYVTQMRQYQAEEARQQ